MSMARVTPAPPASLYKTDFHAWAKQQAALVRAGRFDEIDRDHLAEEIESLGKSEERGLQSSYKLIMLNLLKIMFQPEKRSDGWEETIIRERSNATDDIATFPGLKPKRDDLFARAYPLARSLAAKETRMAIRTFPVDPPFTRQQVENEEWWP